jgi:hypothetical protein
MAEVFIECPPPSSISQPAFPKSADSDTIITFHPNQAMAHTADTQDNPDQQSSTTTDTDSDESVTHDELRAARPRSKVDYAEPSHEASAGGV